MIMKLFIRNVYSYKLIVLDLCSSLHYIHGMFLTNISYATADLVVFFATIASKLPIQSVPLSKTVCYIWRSW